MKQRFEKSIVKPGRGAVKGALFWVQAQSTDSRVGFCPPTQFFLSDVPKPTLLLPLTPHANWPLFGEMNGKLSQIHLLDRWGAAIILGRICPAANCVI